MFRDIPDAEAEATAIAAWQQGTRYGVSEVRLGKALAKHKRDEYRISSKIGHIILDEVDPEARNFGEEGGGDDRAPECFARRGPERIAEDHAALKETIPDEFWQELRKQQLVSADAPLPIDREKEQAGAPASVDRGKLSGTGAQFYTVKTA